MKLYSVRGKRYQVQSLDVLLNVSTSLAGVGAEAKGTLAEIGGRFWRTPLVDFICKIENKVFINLKTIIVSTHNKLFI